MSSPSAPIRRMICLAAALIVAASACADSADPALEERLTAAEQRIAQLEAQMATTTTVAPTTTTTEPPGVLAPPVIGLPLDRAAAALEAAGLRWVVAERDITADDPHGTVIDQLPSGQVAVGTAIGLVVSVDPAVRALAELSVQQADDAAALAASIVAANTVWEERGADYQTTRTAMSEAAQKLDGLATAVSGAQPPEEYEGEWGARLVALQTLADAADEVIAGLDASDDGSRRRAAVEALVAADATHTEACATFAAAAYLGLLEGGGGADP